MFVSAGTIGRQVAQAATGEGLAGGDLKLLIVGSVVTVVSGLYVGLLAKKALNETDDLEGVEASEDAGI